MKLKFEFVDEGNVNIMATNEVTGENRKVGHIFTPSGSGQDSKNAIQVCGFSEAFDLWGCAIFAKPKIEIEGMIYVRDGNGNKVYEQAKDIQLVFESETRQLPGFIHQDCNCCYNNPCTCEVRVRHENPYTVKREQDIWIEKELKDGKNQA